MRRISTLLATTAVLAPLIVAASALPAAASGPSVTVTEIGRQSEHVNGAQVIAQDMTSDRWYIGQSGKAMALPKGRYAVLGDVFGKDGSDTLAAQVVNISGPTTVVLDARRGKPVKVALNLRNAAAYDRFVTAQICANHYPMGITALNNPGSLYAVPNSSSGLSFGYLGGWRSNGTSYLVTGRTSSGVPTAPGGSLSSSGLARLDIQARTGTDTYDSGQLVLQPEPSDNGCDSGLWGDLGQRQLPAATTVYLSPGPWTPRIDSNAGGGEFGSARYLHGGTHYYQTFNQAVWGPKQATLSTWYHRLSLEPNLIADPTPGVMSMWGTAGTYRLSENGKLLHQQNLNGSQNTFDTQVSTSGWYDLSLSVHRYLPGRSVPSSTLTSAVDLKYHFWLTPSVNQVAPVYTTRFFPAGLDAANRAAPGSTTAVGLVLDQVNPDPNFVRSANDPATSVKVWASANGGITWQAVTVKHVNGGWTAYVPNPASGAVSLRSQVSDAHGDYAVESIYRAYAIG